MRIAPTCSAAALRASALPRPPVNEAVADAAVRLVRALRYTGWIIHQHAPKTVVRHEPGSVPIPESSFHPEARALAADIERRLFAAFDRTPPPTLRVREPTLSYDEHGGLHLPVPDYIDPTLLERTHSITSSVDEAVALWRELIPELVMGWAVFPEQPPLSLGRLFLERKKGRMCYWPKYLNRLMAHIPITYDNIVDLVRCLTLCGIKVDLKSAFRSLLIARRHARYYGASVDGVYVEFHRACFGSGCSPAHFVLVLRNTLRRARYETTSFDRALAAFVDDLGAGAGDGSGGRCVATASVHLMRTADRLTTALIEDGWWQSLGKTFYWPASPMVFTGQHAVFDDGSIAITPEKAAALRERLAGVGVPSAESFARLLSPSSSTQGDPATRSRVVPQIRTAVHSQSQSPLAVAALPIEPSDWPHPPFRLLTLGILGPALFARPLPTGGHQESPWPDPIDIATAQDVASTVTAALHPPLRPPPATHFLLVATASLAAAHDLVASYRPHLTPSRTTVVVAYPRDAEPRLPADWFDRSLQLPPSWPTARPLPPPPHVTAPPALPHRDAPPPRPTPRDVASLDVSPDDFVSLRGIAGLLSWFSTCVQPLSAWRPHLDAAWQHGRWSPEAAEAVAFLWDAAPYLPSWRRQVRRQPTRTLHVHVDTARGSWASMGHAPDGGVYVDAGCIPFHARAASTLAREAHGAVGAIAAAIRRNVPFDSVDVTTDNEGLARSAGTGHVPTMDAGPAMRAIAALDYQGVSTRWKWSSRALGLMPTVDALSPAASVQVYPLLPHIASFVWDMVGGWDADGPSASGRSWSSRYLTGTTPEEVRQALFRATATMVADAPDGWIGDLAAWPRLAEGRVLFAHGLWSELPRIADVAETGAPMVVVAPATRHGDWWDPALASLERRATARIRLPEVCLRYPMPRPGHEAAASRRQLCVYVLGPLPSKRRPRPAWWTPYRLTEDGDVEENPGPTRWLGEEDALALARSSRPAAPGAGARGRPGTCPPSPRPQPHAATARPVPASFAREDAMAMAAAAAPPPPLTQAAPAVDRPTRQRPIRPPDPTAAPPPKRPRVARPSSPAVAAAAAAPPQVRSAPPVRMTAPPAAPAAPAAPPTTPQLLLGDMVDRALAFVQGAGGAVDGAVPEALRPHLQQSAHAARKPGAASDGDRVCKVPRYMQTLVNHMGIRDTAATPAVVEALACAYTHHRLRDPPPFKWRKVEPTGVMSDLSSYAETLRLSGLLPACPKYCGATAQRELERKGGKDKPEHSHAYPLHLSVLLATAVPKEPRLRRARAFLIVMSFFCLRTGITFLLSKANFLGWAGGYLLIWRFATKRRQGDASKPQTTLPTTRKVHYSGARHQWLREFFAAAPDGPLFRGVTYDDLNDFIRTFLPGVPDAFDVRTYGARVAADTEAVELKCPQRLINMSFDWTPVKKKMSSHYSGNNLLLMYQLSEERANCLHAISIAPGIYAIVYRGAELPSWDMPMLDPSAPPLPNPDPVEVQAVWKAPPPERRGRPAASGAGASAPRASSPTLSVDCADCGDHVNRRETAAMCEVPSCPWGKCLTCFPDLSLELYCPHHGGRT